MKLHFRVRPKKYPLLVIVLKQFNAAHIATLFAIRSILILYSHPCPGRPGSSVGIENDYRLEVSGSNPGGDEIFRPSRPAL